MANLDSKLDEVRKTSYAYFAESMTGERNEAHAWLAFARAQIEIAVKFITSIPDKQDCEGKGEVELPAREMLADILLRHSRNTDFAFRTDANRLNPLLGAKRAETSVGR